VADRAVAGWSRRVGRLQSSNHRRPLRRGRGDLAAAVSEVQQGVQRTCLLAFLLFLSFVMRAAVASVPDVEMAAGRVVRELVQLTQGG